MVLQKMKCDPLIPQKRPLDHSIYRKLEELSKRRTLVQAVRDFPPGCGPCGTNEGDRKPLNISKNMHSDPVETDKFNGSKPRELGIHKPCKVKFWDPTCMKADYDQKPKLDSNMSKMASNGADKWMNSQSVADRRIKSFEPKELGRNKSYLGSRSTPKVKYWDPTCVKEDEAQKSKVATAVESRKEEVRREKIKEAMTVFDQVYGPLSQKNRLKPKGEKTTFLRVSIEAMKIVKQKLKWVDPEKTLGHVCGVQIGDKFKYRSQLVMIGLHCQHRSGIDYTSVEGTNVAISIVDSHRYSNESISRDTLVYSGHGGGGLVFMGCKSPLEDQKLEKGNLALKNSIKKKTPVRVIRKLGGFEKNNVFVYDGLYIVDHYTKNKSAQGKIVFKFHLKRVPGQPSLHKMLNSSG